MASETSNDSAVWLTEPDDSEWITAAKLRAKALRHPKFGHWCGYIEVPDGHPLYGVYYSQESPALAAAWEARKQQPIGENPPFSLLVACAFGGDHLTPTPENVFRVHGGITFAGTSYWTDPRAGWWLGFDCGHCDDLQPGMEKFGISVGAVYRDLPYVFAECESLAEQLASITAAPKEPRDDA